MRRNGSDDLRSRLRPLAVAIAIWLSLSPAGAFDQVITQQSVFLTGGGGSESILVDRGRLDLAAAATPYGYQITLDRGLLSGEGILAAPVDYVNGAILGSASEANDLTIEGVVSGTGSLAIVNQTELLGGLSVGGNLYINNRAGAVVSGPFDVAGETFIDRYSLALNGRLGDVGGRFRIAPTFITADASLSFGSDATIDQITLDPRGSDREGTYDRTRLLAADGANLTVRAPIDFYGGVVDGAVQGQSTLVKRGVTEGFLDNFADAGFQQVLIEEGSLTLRGDAGDATPELLLSPGKLASIATENAFRGTVRLSGRLGVAQAEGLFVPDQRAFAGDLFLGRRGQLTSNGVTGGHLTSEARIHGGDLHLPGRWPLKLEGGSHTYTGDTFFSGGEITLSGAGRLNSTRAIVGSGRPSATGGRSLLVLDNSSSVHEDRVPDATPVSLGGMELRLVGQSGVEVTERLGSVRLGGGVSDLVVENPGGGQTTLRIDALERGGTGTVVFRGLESDASVFIDDVPPLANGLIGPWALVGGVTSSGDSDFATYSPNGVVPYSATNLYRTTLSGAAPTDNVSLETQNQPVVLDEDTQVNALRTRQNTLDLAGNTLSIQSGGFLARPLQRTITRDGFLTAGDGTADVELMTYGNHQIEASITDNGTASVGLTHGVSVGNNSSDVILAGANTFGGPITINSSDRVASITITNPLAIPTGADVVLDGGHLRFDLPSDSDSVPLPALGSLTVRDAGRVFRLGGIAPELRFSELILESGTIGVPIVGDTPIRKTTHGVARFDESVNILDQHTGPILIEEGLLGIGRIGQAPITEQHAITVRRDGVLQSLGTIALSGRLIRLDGGTMEGLFATPIELTAPDGQINGSLLAGAALVGEEDLLFVAADNVNAISEFNADLTEYNGDLTFRGRTVQVTGSNPGYAGTVRVENASFFLSGQGSFGDATLEITPAGTMAINKAIDANIHLAGGVIRLFETSTGGGPLLFGGLEVSDESHVFLGPRGDRQPLTTQVFSAVRLNDGSRLIVSELPGQGAFVQDTFLSHRLQLGWTVEVIGDAAIESFETLVDITGTLLSKTKGATLDLAGGDMYSLRSSIRLEDSGTLQVTRQGSPVEFSLAGLGLSIAGTGTFRNDLELSQGAVVSPGASAGKLTIDGDITLGDQATYLWELENPTARAGEGWDLLQVEGAMAFEDDWVLELRTVGGAILPDFGRWLIAEADTLTGFDPSLVRLSPDARFSRLIERLQLVQVGNALYLVAVPEPTSGSLLLVLGLFCRAAVTVRCPSSNR